MRSLISILLGIASASAIGAQALVILIIWKAMQMPPDIDEAITTAARAAKAALWACGLSIITGLIAMAAPCIYKPRRRS